MRKDVGDLAKQSRDNHVRVRPTPEQGFTHVVSNPYILSPPIMEGTKRSHVFESNLITVLKLNLYRSGVHTTDRPEGLEGSP